jgi:hypothetical protein
MSNRKTVCRSGTAFFGRGEGKSVTRSVASATQSTCTGQAAHLGLLRIQMMAPMSISAWV